MKFLDQTGATGLITLTKKALKPLESMKSSITDVNGIVKSDGSGGFSAATAGTDYAAASHTHNKLTPEMVANGYCYLDTGTGSLDVVQVKNGHLVNNDMGEMAAFVLLNGKWHEVKGTKVL